MMESRTIDREEYIQIFTTRFKEEVGDKANPVFIDLDKYKNAPDDNEKIKQFKADMEREHPGLIKAIGTYVHEKYPEIQEEEALDSYLKVVVSSDGPATFAHIKYGGHDNTVLAVMTPDESTDPRNEYTRALQYFKYSQDKKDSILSGITMSAAFEAKVTATHEARHALQPARPRLELVAATNMRASHEVGAEQGAIDWARKNGENPAFIQQRIDMRVLTQPVSSEEYSVLGQSLDTGHEHVVSTGRTNRADFFGAVDRHLPANANLGETLQKRPDEFFKAMNKAVDEWKQEAKDIKSGFSGIIIDKEEAERLIQLQAKINNAESFEGAYRRMVLKQDFPVKPPTIIITPEEREGYIQKYDIAANDSGPEGTITHNKVTDTPAANDSIVLQTSHGGQSQLASAIVSNITPAEPPTGTPTRTPAPDYNSNLGMKIG